eukprot:scaffold61805_cov66-Phaeocystis_antarctica.AAC.2
MKAATCGSALRAASSAGRSLYGTSPMPGWGWGSGSGWGLGIGFESKLGSPGRKGPNPLRHEGSELDEQAAIVRPQKLFSQKSTVACT